MLVFAGDDQRIEEIERRGFDAHDGLARARGGRWDVGKLEFLGRAEMRAEDGFHGELVLSLGKD